MHELYEYIDTLRDILDLKSHFVISTQQYYIAIIYIYNFKTNNAALIHNFGDYDT